MMFYPPNFPNQQNNSSFRSALKEAAPSILFRVVIVVLVGCAMFILVRDLAGLGGFLGFSVSRFFEGAGLDPRNRGGFENFLKLVLLAGGVWVMWKLFDRGGGQ